jgi:two-component system NarL family sensor kinase
MDTQEARIYLAVIISGIVIGTIIVYFTISVLSQQRKNIALQKANALAEISAMENERARIAADLHDDMAPVLSVVKFRVDHAALEGENDKEQLLLASGQLDELIIRMREIANNLMPSALHRKGLLSAVGEFTRDVKDTSKLDISLVAADELPIPEDKGIHVYRMIQEIVHNCVKHARATKLELRFAIKSKILQVVCRDNGDGFNYATAITLPGHIGLRSIKNRTELMGGSLRVESEPHKGTIFIIDIPIQ